jgi:hypothetical protein
LLHPHHLPHQHLNLDIQFLHYFLEKDLLVVYYLFLLYL